MMVMQGTNELANLKNTGPVWHTSRAVGRQTVVQRNNQSCNAGKEKEALNFSQAGQVLLGLEGPTGALRQNARSAGSSSLDSLFSKNWRVRAQLRVPLCPLPH